MKELFRDRLLQWYDQSARLLPWRARYPDVAHPYSVWVSEMMLQQTTVATVVPYFLRFIERFPTVQALAGASLDEVFTLWQGLGYYSRARYLHQAAQRIVNENGGVFPQTAQEWQNLPGVGPYASAAIGAIALNEAVVPVDGNVMRVLSRVYGNNKPLPALKSDIQDYAHELAASHRSGDFAQALMELGALICTPRSPRCDTCPVSALCRALDEGKPEQYPIKGKKTEKRIQHAHAFIYLQDGQVALRRRPEKGLLAGLLEVPTTPWVEQKAHEELGQPCHGAFQHLNQSIIHVFTHIHLTVHLWRARDNTKVPAGCQWFSLNELAQHPVPTLTKKIIQRVKAVANPT